MKTLDTQIRHQFSINSEIDEPLALKNLQNTLYEKLRKANYQRDVPGNIRQNLKKDETEHYLESIQNYILNLNSKISIEDSGEWIYRNLKNTNFSNKPIFKLLSLNVYPSIDLIRGLDDIFITDNTNNIA